MRLTGLLLHTIAALALAPGAVPAAEPFIVRNDRISVEAGLTNGAITCVLDKASGIALAPPEALAGNFRLILVKPDKTTATIIGRDQKLTGARVGDGEMTLNWAGPMKDTSGADHKLRARMTIKLVGPSAQFTLHVENGTECKVREAWYPLIGGLSSFGAKDKPDGTFWVPTSTPWEKPAQIPFGQQAFGYPGQMNMSFACLQSKSAGKTLYLSSQDPVARYKAYRLAEEEESTEKDVFFCIQHSPFTPPGGSFDGSSVVLRVVDGDWQAAGRVYREWFEKTFGIAKPSEKGNWIRQESFFVMTMFMLPEGTINLTFRDIPRWAKAAKDHGINAVQISGWQMGGHDNGYPYYVPDPRLGTWKELEDGIRAAHKMGVKVYFFVNYQPMMVESDWYKNELQKYREMGPNGEHTWMAGWGMGTLWARMGHPKLMTWADLSFPQYRRIIVDQFAALAKIGADGVHVDKMFPTAIDYNPDIPLSPDTATWEGAIQLTKEVITECRKYNPIWAMSFETNWDRMLQFTGATWWVGNQLITRKVFPENAETLGLYQAYDYLGVNNAIRGGHAVMVAPLNFSRSIDWAPFRGLADYIKEVKRIRDSLRDTVFYGEALGPAGAKLKGQAAGVECNVFRNRSTGRRVAILTNSQMESRTQVIEGFEQPGGLVRVHVPFRRPVVLKLPASVEVPPERIAFVEEYTGRSDTPVGLPGKSAGPTGSGSALSGRSAGPTGSGSALSGRSAGPTGSGSALPGRSAGPTGSSSALPGRSAGPTGSGSALSGRSAGPTGSGSALSGRSAGPTGTVANGAFETGTFDGWVADPNWKIMDNGLAWYSGWQGKYWAWSGGTGEAAMGKLRSKPFVLDKDCVRMLISGWNSIQGTGNPRKWNYITLNLEDGTEIDRVYAPNITQFVSAFLDGSRYKGRKVYIEAVDDADQATYSMLCIDDVRTADLPPGYAKPVRVPPPFDPKKSLRLEDDAVLVEVSRSNGSITRIMDKKSSLDLILEPRLAGSYRFALVLPGKEPWQGIEANWIFGKQQKLSSHTLGGKKLTLRWDAPLANYGGAKYAASVTETIELVGGGLLMNLSIDNRTPYQVGEVYFPVIGGIQGIGKTFGQLKTTEMARPTKGDSAATSDIFRVFNNMSWLGDQGPEQFYQYPEAQPEPWVALCQPKLGRSVYIGAHDPGNRKQVIRLELVPASSGTPREDGNWPRPEELSGQPCGVELSFVDIAGLPARKLYQAAPVFIKFHDGDWRESRRVYQSRSEAPVQQ